VTRHGAPSSANTKSPGTRSPIVDHPAGIGIGVVSASGAPSWPPLKGTTLLLWFGPGLLFVAALLALVLYLRRRDQAIQDAPLTAEEQRRAEALLQDQDSRQRQP
jgi:hypothetical protein